MEKYKLSIIAKQTTMDGLRSILEMDKKANIAQIIEKMLFNEVEKNEQTIWAILKDAYYNLQNNSFDRTKIIAIKLNAQGMINQEIWLNQDLILEQILAVKTRDELKALLKLNEGEKITNIVSIIEKMIFSNIADLENDNEFNRAKHIAKRLAETGKGFIENDLIKI